MYVHRMLNNKKAEWQNCHTEQTLAYYTHKKIQRFSEISNIQNILIYNQVPFVADQAVVASINQQINNILLLLNLISIQYPQFQI